MKLILAKCTIQPKTWKALGYISCNKKIYHAMACKGHREL